MKNKYYYEIVYDLKAYHPISIGCDDLNALWCELRVLNINDNVNVEMYYYNSNWNDEPVNTIRWQNEK